MEKPFLEIDALTKRYPNPEGGDLTVFQDVSFDIDKGEFVCIIGHSGCGKSTIMNVLAGLDTATSGAVTMDGKEVVAPIHPYRRRLLLGMHCLTTIHPCHYQLGAHHDRAGPGEWAAGDEPVVVGHRHGVAEVVVTTR
jgi:energy-coupling factor transporter ATP-binding protein EcfA2